MTHFGLIHKEPPDPDVDRLAPLIFSFDLFDLVQRPKSPPRHYPLRNSHQNQYLTLEIQYHTHSQCKPLRIYTSCRFNTTTTHFAARFRKRHQQVSLSLSPGSDYTLSFTLSSTSPAVSLYLDTGSDLVWLPYHPFECILCESKPEKPVPLNLSATASSVSCQSPVCSSAHSSLPAQLSSLFPHLGNRFSYCLVSHNFDSDRVHLPSPLILGRYDDNKTRVQNNGVEFIYTDMLDNPKHPYFYSVGLKGISVGKNNIPAPGFLRSVDLAGNGGMVVDSGTTFTMLPASLYNSVLDAFEHRVGRVHERATQVEEKTGLSPCYYFDDGLVNVPVLKLNFVGNGSSVVLPRRNYFHEFMEGR